MALFAVQPTNLHNFRGNRTPAQQVRLQKSVGLQDGGPLLDLGPGPAGLPDDFVQGDARMPLDDQGQPDQRAVGPVFPPQKRLQARFPPPGRLSEPEPFHQVLRIRDDVRHPLPAERTSSARPGRAYTSRL